MYELILHVGFPKTATTTLQNGLFCKLINHINYLGITDRGTKYHIFRKVLRPWLNSNGNTGAENLKSLLKARSRFGINLLSEETFTNCHGNAGLIFDPLKIIKIFGPIYDSIRIVLVVRNQVGLINSQFAHTIRIDKYNKALEADEYINKILDDNLNNQFYFSNILKRYQSVFGENKVSLLFFEDFVNDKKYFLSEWSRILRVSDKLLIKELGEAHFYQKKRSSDNSYVVKFKYEPNSFKRLIKSIPFSHLIFSKLSSFGIIKYLDKLNNKPSKKEIKIPIFNTEQKNRIKRYYLEDNLELLKTASVSEEKLKKFNYI